MRGRTYTVTAKDDPSLKASYSFAESEFTTNANCCLFASMLNETTLRPFAGKIYNAKIYNGDSLVRDFVPCYRKEDNVIGMYDLISNTFYTNSGTGDFEKGQDV